MGRKISLLYKNPTPLNQDSLLDYKELTTRYPYCQCARLMFLLNLRAVDDQSTYKSTLPITAINLPDRTRLKELLENGPSKQIELRPKAHTQSIETKQNEVLPRRHTESFSPWSQALPSRQTRPVQQNETPIFRPVSEPIAKPSENKKIRVEDVRAVLNRPVSVAKPKAKADALIERFLKEDPTQISKIKMDKDFDYDAFDPDTGHSNREDFSFGTETLAEMYLKNNSPKKAIAIYEHLGLKFPEKSSYFANLIKEVKKIYHIK